MDARNLFLLGARHHQKGETDQATDCYRQALAHDPNLGEAALYLGLALHQEGRLIEAEEAYEKALAILPGDPDVLNGLGAVFLEQGKPDQARRHHLHALKLRPDSPEALDGLGNASLASGQTDEAILFFEKALILTPEAPDTLSNLGVALKMAGRLPEAVSRFEAALSLAPDQSDTLYNLGNAWQARGDMGKAMSCYLAAHRVDPHTVTPRWGACFAHLDLLFDTPQAIESTRKKYASALSDLDVYLTEDNLALMREAAGAVGANQPFYLTYQGENDRELQQRYGMLVSRIIKTAFPHLASHTFTPRQHPKIRVGIATGFFHEHSVWKIPTRGWVRHLDRDTFEVFGYYTGVKQDHCTEEARSLFDKFTNEPNRFESLCRTILDDELDVLLYPDIGMDPTCAKLAGLRLAPAQAVSLGHPMTTGLPDMDYFLSSELMEPEDGQNAYTETLIRLPNLSVHYEPLRRPDSTGTRDSFDLPEGAPLYFCPQSLYKYLPQYDALFPRIASRVPNCRFVFLQNARADVLNARFLSRLDRCFTEHGLVMDEHVIMLPHQPPDAYQSLNRLCDVFLDSIEWSGFNTIMEAVNAELPPVILPKGHMRGRHSLAVVTRLALNDVVAGTFDEYVELAARMGTDQAWRNRLRQRIRINLPHLFRDMEAIHGLERFLETVATKNRRSP